MTGGVSVGAASTIAGVVQITDATASADAASGALVVTGGAGVGGALNVDGDVKFESTTTSDATNTGALSWPAAQASRRTCTWGGTSDTVGAATFQNLTSVTDTTDATAADAAAFTVAGGAGIAKTLIIRS